MNRIKKITLIGASGSIGQQSIEILKLEKEKFNLIGIGIGENIDYLELIIKEFPSIQKVSVKHLEDIKKLEKKYPKINFYFGDQGLIEIAKIKADLFINAVVGFTGLIPTKVAIETKNNIALANKETIVAGGKLILDLAKKNNVKILPIDSEHSAIFQCLKNEDKKEIKKILLTASGGSFRDLTIDQLETVTKKQALEHPNWSMGDKITIDSATMMNKGLELIEAVWLFDVEPDEVEVVMHKESVIHSMVEYIDGSIIAHLGQTDMRIPIMYTLSYPMRLENNFLPSLNFAKLKSSNFFELDFDKYQCLEIAYRVARLKDKYQLLPCVMNAANEACVELFLNEKIKFLEIPKIIKTTVENNMIEQDITFENLVTTNNQIKSEIINKFGG